VTVPEPVTLTTTTVEATEAIGRRLGRLVEPGDVVALVGDLGAGKTAFVRGLGDGLGVPGHLVASPTFTMIAEYPGGRLPLFHVDLYRLEPGAADLPVLAEYVHGGGVTAIEWPDRLPAGALDACLTVRIEYADPGRRLTFEGRGARAASLVAALAAGT
jgi:tRNA threonylcarbamoyladenosine biosynthesis protein TsaE